MKVLNLWGGPGSGKSTLAAGVFFIAKTKGMSIEYVPEWVKPFAYTVADDHKWPTQMEILDHQTNWLSRFDGHVEWVVTDSPIKLQLAYTDDPLEREAIERASRLFSNVDVWVKRLKTYVPTGRRESEASARAVDERLRDEHPERFDFHVSIPVALGAYQLVREVLGGGTKRG